MTSKKAHKRRHGVAPVQRPETLPVVCACGRRRAGHPTCAACGILVGDGHEGTVEEPHGRKAVCAGCWRHLAGRGWRIRFPFGRAGEGVVLRRIDRPGADVVLLDDDDHDDHVEAVG